MVLSMGKRGVSPLIATILLIAFAVALGAVIMQFGEAATGVCGSNIIIQPTLACVSADGSNVKFVIANKGSDDITSLDVEVKGSSSSNMKNLAVKIPTSGSKEGNLPYVASVFGELQGVTFTPVIDSTKCAQNAVHMPKIQLKIF